MVDDTLFETLADTVRKIGQKQAADPLLVWQVAIEQVIVELHLGIGQEYRQLRTGQALALARQHLLARR